MTLLRAPSIAVLIALAAGGPAEAGELTPAFASLLRQVQEGDLATRRTFARMALTAMAEAYEQELQSPGGPRRRKQGQDTARWRAEIAGVASDLRRRAEDVASAGRIALAQDGPDSVRLIIDGRNVILQGPRIDAPELLEGRIVAAACVYIACPSVEGQAATPDTPSVPTLLEAPYMSSDWPVAPATASAVTGVWFELPQGGAVFRTQTGLNFQFTSALELAARAALCERLAADFEAVVLGLGFALQQGWPIVHDSLRLGPEVDGLASLVVNPLGDTVRLHIQAPEALKRLLPVTGGWLAARVRGASSQHYFPEAERYLHTEPAPTLPRGWQALPP